MKKYLILFIFCISMMYSDILFWRSSYHGNFNVESVNDMVIDSAGGVFMIGSKTRATTNYLFFVIHNNFYGERLWQIEGGGHIFSIELDTQGNPVVCGYRKRNNQKDWLIKKYDKNTGDLILSSEFDLIGNNDEAYDLKLDASDNIYVTGYTMASFSAHYRMTLVKFDGNTGQEIWRRFIVFSDTFKQMQTGKFVSIDNSGNVYVSGDIYREQSLSLDIVVAKFSPNGDTIWTTVVWTGYDDLVRDMKIDTSGGIIVLTAQTGPFANTDFLNFALNINNGSLVWADIYDGYTADAPSELTILNNKVYIAGTQGPSQTNSDYVVLVYNKFSGLFLDTFVYDNSGNIDQCNSIDAASRYIYLTGKTSPSGSYYDIWTLKIDTLGNIVSEKIFNGSANRNDFGSKIRTYNYSPKTTVYYVGGKYEGVFSGDTTVAGVILAYSPTVFGLYTRDSLALGLNNGRNLLRDKNTGKIHLVYSDSNDIKYTYSADEGSEWQPVISIGQGKYPALSLDRNGLPCVVWIDDNGSLYFRKQNSDGTWGSLQVLYNGQASQGKVTSPPSIVISTHRVGRTTKVDSAHILYNLYSDVNGINRIMEVSFEIGADILPLNTKVIEDASGILPSKVENPSISYSKPLISVPAMLHAVWQHGDTIYYATREIGKPDWDVWGWQFYQEGTKSSHPFISVYGDSVFVVWQRKEGDMPWFTEVYRASKYIPSAQPNFSWSNFSQTPVNMSIYPSIAGGTYTVFADDYHAYIEKLYEVSYRVKATDTLSYITNSPWSNSTYPETDLRRTISYDRLFVVWLEREEPPYRIKFKKVDFSSSQTLASYGNMKPFSFPSNSIRRTNAYYTSDNGKKNPSVYNTKRDGFYSSWYIPVDVGYNKLKYRFPLDSGYIYIMKLIFYNGFNYILRNAIIIDGNYISTFEINPGVPETLDVIIPSDLYQEDEEVEVEIKGLQGKPAVSGPIYIYRYETEDGIGSGIQTSGNIKRGISLVIPTFVNSDYIEFNSIPVGKYRIDIFDMAGRRIYGYESKRVSSIPFKAGSGSYILIIRDTGTREVVRSKIIKLR